MIKCNLMALFSWLGMLIRSSLAALDFNFNVDRKIKKSADGKPMYKMKVSYYAYFAISISVS